VREVSTFFFETKLPVSFDLFPKRRKYPENKTNERKIYLRFNIRLKRWKYGRRTKPIEILLSPRFAPVKSSMIIIIIIMVTITGLSIVYDSDVRRIRKRKAITFRSVPAADVCFWQNPMANVVGRLELRSAAQWWRTVDKSPGWGVCVWREGRDTSG